MSLDVKHIFFRAAQQWKFEMNFSVQSRAYLTFLHVTLDKADRHLEECEWRGFISIMSTGFRSVAPAVYQSFPQAVSYLPYLISPTPHVLCPGGTRSSVGSGQTKRPHTVNSADLVSVLKYQLTCYCSPLRHPNFFE